MLKKRQFLLISLAILLSLMTVPWSLAKAESPVIQARRANHVPVAYDLVVKTKEDTPVGIILWATDQDGDPLTYEITSQPSHGKLEGSGQRWTYTPSRDFNGTDKFTYKAYDGKLWSKDARVTIHVRKANDAPQA